MSNIGNPDRRLKGFYTVKEAATYLSISEKSVRRLISRGHLRPSKALRKLRIPAQQLEEFLLTPVKSGSITGSMRVILPDAIEESAEGLTREVGYHPFANAR